MGLASLFQSKFTGREQRRHARVIPTASAPVEIHIMGDGFLEVVPATDISVGGVAVEVQHGFSRHEMSQEVKLLVAISGQRAFVVRGIIRHARGKQNAGRFGIEFTSLGDPERRIVTNYVTAMLAAGRGA